MRPNEEFFHLLRYDSGPLSFTNVPLAITDACWNSTLNRWQGFSDIRSYSSTDGTNWGSSSSMNGSSYWRSTAFSSSLQKRAIVGTKGSGKSGLVSLLSSSTSSVNGVATQSLPIQMCNDVIWNGTYFIAGGHDQSGSQYGRYYYSSDGSTWTISSYTTTNSLVRGLAVASSSNMVSVGSIGGKSTDNGLSWTSTTIGAPGGVNMNGVVWSSINNRYVAVGDQGYNAYSSDGTTWIAYDDFSGVAWNHIIEANGRFIAVGDGSKYKVSMDGFSWDIYTIPYSINAKKVRWSQSLQQLLILSWDSYLCVATFID